MGAFLQTLFYLPLSGEQENPWLRTSCSFAGVCARVCVRVCAGEGASVHITDAQMHSLRAPGSQRSLVRRAGARWSRGHTPTPTVTPG